MPIIYNTNYNRDIRCNQKNSLRWLDEKIKDKAKYNYSQRGLGFIEDYCILNYGGGVLETLNIIAPLCLLAGVILLFFGGGFFIDYNLIDLAMFLTSIFLIFVPYKYQTYLMFHQKKYIVFDRRNRIVHCPNRFKSGYERISYDDAFMLCLEKEQLPYFTPMQHFFILRPGYLINRKKPDAYVVAPGLYLGGLGVRFYNLKAEFSSDMLVPLAIAQLITFMDWKEEYTHVNERVLAFHKEYGLSMQNFHFKDFTQTDITYYMDEKGEWHRPTLEKIRQVKEKLATDNPIPEDKKIPTPFDEAKYQHYLSEFKKLKASEKDVAKEDLDDFRNQHWPEEI